VLFKNQTEARDINYSASEIADLAPDDPDHIYMPLFAPGMYLMEIWEPPHSRLFRVDVNSGNDVVFRQVLDNLHQSLDQEQQERHRP